ncbi:MAG: hypothetical protein M3220_15065 [Chloroflexota bacterium]|nr:hypothetical protein [Chloroflexota bacterium]
MDREEISPSEQALNEFVGRVVLPHWAPVRLSHEAGRLTDVAAAVAEQFRRAGIGEQIQPGTQVALTAGSRGIGQIDEVLAAVVAEIRARGGEPFIVPAMGSHGGATPAGQVEVLAHYGITEERMACPIRSSMEVVELGQLASGERLYTDRIAFQEADLIIPIARVKVHTDFHGPYESGLYKMLAIGLGKQHGADALHASGFESFPHLIPAAGRVVLERLAVPFGIALVENGYGKLALLEAIPAAEIDTRERELLEESRRLMALLPLERVDVLVVDQIGKDISGAGMDPNVVGRYYNEKLPTGPAVQRIVVLDLTEATEGNATGIGMAEFCTARVAGKIDYAKTYMNQLTAKTPEAGRLPIVAPNDCVAIQMAILSLRRVDPRAVRLLRIKDTKDLTSVWASEMALPELLATGRAEQLGPLEAPAFDADGNLR